MHKTRNLHEKVYGDNYISEIKVILSLYAHPSFNLEGNSGIHTRNIAPYIKLLTLSPTVWKLVRPVQPTPYTPSVSISCQTQFVPNLHLRVEAPQKTFSIQKFLVCWFVHFSLFQLCTKRISGWFLLPIFPLLCSVLITLHLLRNINIPLGSRE